MGNHDEVLSALRGLRFLHDIEASYLDALVPISELKSYAAGAVLFREGQTHPSIYLVLEGSVALEVRVSGREVRRLQTVGPGELLGWSPLLGQVEMTATARALLPTRLVEINGTQLAALCEHDPRFGYTFMKRTAQALSKRLAATRLQLIDIYSHELPAVADEEG